MCNSFEQFCNRGRGKPMAQLPHWDMSLVFLKRQTDQQCDTGVSEADFTHLSPTVISALASLRACTPATRPRPQAGGGLCGSTRKSSRDPVRQVGRQAESGEAGWKHNTCSSQYRHTMTVCMHVWNFKKTTGITKYFCINRKKHHI